MTSSYFGGRSPEIESILDVSNELYLENGCLLMTVCDAHIK